MYGSYIPGKRPCGPKLGFMLPGTLRYIHTYIHTFSICSRQDDVKCTATVTADRKPQLYTQATPLT